MVMGVKVGKEGQEFYLSTYRRVLRIKKKFPTLLIEIDGGISNKNILKLKNCGSQNFCVGNFISGNKNSEKKFEELEKIILK